MARRDCGFIKDYFNNTDESRYHCMQRPCIRLIAMHDGVAPSAYLCRGSFCQVAKFYT